MMDILKFLTTYDCGIVPPLLLRFDGRQNGSDDMAGREGHASMTRCRSARNCHGVTRGDS
jgi:hypothetical protein